MTFGELYLTNGAWIESTLLTLKFVGKNNIQDFAEHCYEKYDDCNVVSFVDNFVVLY